MWARCLTCRAAVEQTCGDGAPSVAPGIDGQFLQEQAKMGAEAEHDDANSIAGTVYGETNIAESFKKAAWFAITKLHIEGASLATRAWRVVSSATFLRSMTMPA